MKLCDDCNKKSQISGQMFTEYKCKICKKLKHYHNTNTPMICLSCAEKHNLCQKCGNSIVTNLAKDNEKDRICKKCGKHNANKVIIKIESKYIETQLCNDCFKKMVVDEFKKYE